MLLNRVLITTTAEIIQLYVRGCCLLLKSFSVFFFFLMSGLLSILSAPGRRQKR